VEHDALAEFKLRRDIALRIARGFIRKLPPSVDGSDIEQAALIGLWQAVSTHTDTAREGYEWYVRCRVRGSILDELRAQDWLPRRARAESGATDAPTLGIIHLEDIRSEYPWADRLRDGRPSPLDVLVVHAEAEEAMRAPLEPKDRRCVELLVFRGLRMVDVAAELGCSEPRVSQRFSRAIETMRAYLTGRYVPPANKHSAISEKALIRILAPRKVPK
jgi:RNA polymerase sigma factor FliA